MNKNKIALKIALDTDDNTLNGMNLPKARRYINKLLNKYTKGFFKDDSWQGVRKIWDAFNDEGFDWGITKSEYRRDDSSDMPTSKKWDFEITFLDNRGKLKTINGIVVASGAGSIQDPLDKYDLVAYV